MSAIPQKINPQKINPSQNWKTEVSKKKIVRAEEGRMLVGRKTSSEMREFESRPGSKSQKDRI